MAQTPYYTKAETDAIEANLRQQYNYGASEYRGFLTKAQTPTLDGWYWATEIGTYTNAGNLVTLASKINMIEKAGATFRLYAIDAPALAVIDNLNSTSPIDALSSNQGKVLNEKIGQGTQTWSNAVGYPANSETLWLGKLWKSNAVTATTDVPGTSSKWVDALDGYTKDLSKKADLVPGKNLFNKATTTDGFYLTNTNSVVALSGFCYSDFIAVVPGSTYKSTVGLRFTTYFDANKNYVAGGASSIIYNAFTIPAGVFFIRFTLEALALKDTCMFQLGSVSTTYEGFSFNIPLAQVPKSLMVNNLTSTDPNLALAAPQGKTLDDKISAIDINGLYRIKGNLVNPVTSLDRTNNVGNFPLTTLLNPLTNPAWQGYMSAVIKVNQKQIYLIPTNPFNTYIAEYDISGNYLRKTTSTNRKYFIPSSDCDSIRIEFYRDVAKGLWTLEDFTTGLDAYTGNSILRKELSGESFANEIPSVRSKIKAVSAFYFLSNVATYINKQHLVENYEEGKNYLTPTTSTNYKNGIKFTKTENFIEELLLRNEGFKLIDRKLVDMKVSSLATDNGLLRWLPIGDSYTDPAYWIKQMQTVGNAFKCPNLTSVGIKRGHVNNAGGDYNEGYSGWRLHSTNPSSGGLATTIYSPSQWAGFSPFLHVAGKKYYGCSRFWKDVVVGNVYSHIETATKFGFSASTGLRTGTVAFPLATGDLMYNYALSKFQEWNGSSWIDSAVVNADFSINLAKYREVWDIQPLNLISLMLGINDFGNDYFGFETNYINYKISLDAFIASAKVDNPTIKFAVCVPPISYGKNGTELIAQRNATMAKLKSKLISDYDLRTAENIYLVDLCNSLEDKSFGDVSTANSWTTLTQVSDLDSKIIQNDTTHPNNSYATLAKNMAAFIQGIR